MKVTVFSSNQPRHLNLVRELSKISDEIFFISENNKAISYYKNLSKKSKIIQTYLMNLISSEISIFNNTNHLPENVKTISIDTDGLDKQNNSQLDIALSSDVYIIFGASYIKGWLIDFLVKNKAINIHMGLAPYYRGAACNFWAMFDNKPEYVGATIHYLSKGLDNGDILFHCLPKRQTYKNPFFFTMQPALTAQKALVNVVKNETIFTLKSIKQDKSHEIRYSRSQDFNHIVANNFLQKNININTNNIIYPNLIDPIFG